MKPDSRAAALEIGERLFEGPSRHLVDIAFARELDAQAHFQEAVGWTDLAHTLTLMESRVIPREAGKELVAALLALQSGPADFSLDPQNGDLYTNREAWLTRRTPAVGWLGAGRARREALTTAFHLTLCDALCGLADGLVAALEALAALSLQCKDSLMPDYTYLQAAQPTSFGHYLQTFAWPILRDLDRIASLHARVDLCPAGIGACNGSTLPQDRWALARRLGFPAPVRHARDAMWQADLPIEACAIAVAATINLDRLAEDMMIFASAEFGFVRLADRHARASKIMPQKRNPFALAFVRATANRLIGAQAGVAAAGRSPSGQMDNRLFVYDAAPDSLRAAGDAATLFAEVLAGVAFETDRALAALADRSVCAGDLAERLTAQAGVDYRRAHGAIGQLVSQLEAEGRSLAQVCVNDLRSALQRAGTDADPDCLNGVLRAALDPAHCLAARSDHGGAAGPEVAAMAQDLRAAGSLHKQGVAALRARRAAAIDALLAEASNLVAREA
ncbi:MAG: lyase family protein [Methylocystis sp.]|uniref:lyase family protein n=1 Tax=Methylocystis sp. TaxID=1911079 RepID=UPI003DA1D806